MREMVQTAALAGSVPCGCRVARRPVPSSQPAFPSEMPAVFFVSPRVRIPQATERRLPRALVAGLQQRSRTLRATPGRELPQMLRDVRGQHVGDDLAARLDARAGQNPGVVRLLHLGFVRLNGPGTEPLVGGPHGRRQR